MVIDFLYQTTRTRLMLDQLTTKILTNSCRKGNDRGLSLRATTQHNLQYIKCSCLDQMSSRDKFCKNEYARLTNIYKPLKFVTLDMRTIGT
jgi:hypothetical protein